MTATSTADRRLSPIQLAILIGRAAMEAGIVAALAWWGARTPQGTAVKLVLGIAAPVVGFGVWGAVDFRRAGRYAERLRLAEELAISLGASAALAATGQHALGAALGVLSLGYHIAVYATGGALLDHDVSAA